jgi:hypothetical protein
MSSIYRGNIQKWKGKVTPASIHGCRVAVKDQKEYFVASGNEVLLLRVGTTLHLLKYNINTHFIHTPSINNVIILN